MNRLISLLLLFIAGLSPLQGQDAQKSEPNSWRRSVVSIEVARKQFDYYQPWTRKTSRVQKTGVVVAERQVLTTADELFDRTLVRLQKGGRGRWFMGEVNWVDYHANLALVTVAEESFWSDLQPATLGGTMPEDGNLQIVRWKDGNLERRRAEFTRFAVREGQLASVNHVALEADSDIQSAGWGEIVSANSHIVGILSAQDGRSCTAIPASFVRDIIEARKIGKYSGLGYFPFYWQPAQNPAALGRLGLTGEPRGVIVISVPPRLDGYDPVLKPEDIILSIDGFKLDIQGDYEDPEYGHVMLENLATRGKWAGDEVKMEIWREGKPLEVSYRLPKYDFTNSLVPFATFDQDPEYLIVGGLVFQPLTDTYLQSWGSDWRRRSPFRLFYYRNDQPTKERSGLVLLSQVLPDPYNIGYQEQKWLVLDKVNGQSINCLADVRAALQKPANGFHIIDFVRSDSLRRMVLEAGNTEQEATARVLKRYGINEPFHFVAQSKP
ncbi:MAG TPA: serine protease [Clostridia bacterium]|nr:serine protease [Clostridia bacterium]